jgi:rubrerythrin
MHAKTKANLLTAMHGEAFAYGKYMLFAKEARGHGHGELADLYEKTANVEFLEHFAEEAKLAGLLGSDVENLKDAIKGESYEIEEMYKTFAKQAKDLGDQDAAERFEEVRGDEKKHKDAFRAALAELEGRVAAVR